jgi:hypothetical protein
MVCILGPDSVVTKGSGTEDSVLKGNVPLFLQNVPEIFPRAKARGTRGIIINALESKLGAMIAVLDEIVRVVSLVKS